jgi:hypothetical protein
MTPALFADGARRLFLAFLVVGLSCLGGLAQQPSPAPPAIVDGRVAPQTGLFSFAVPAGWALGKADAPVSVRLEHAESDAYFVIGSKRAVGGTIDEELQAMHLALPFLGGTWQLRSRGYRKIGGKRAGEIVSARTFPGEAPLLIHSYVVIHRGLVYLLEFSVTEAWSSQVDASRAQMLDSFVWLKPPAKRN